MKRNGAEYTSRTILDPRDGDLYSAMMTLTPGWPDALVVRGYLGISLLGKNQYWTRLPEGCLQRDRSSLQSPSAASSWPQGRRRDEVNSLRHPDAAQLISDTTAAWQRLVWRR